jgi:hypothetical protein
MKSVTIAGAMAQKPGRGGHTWVFLQYLLGFRQLGWDVVFLDRLEPEMSRDESGAAVPIERSWNVKYFCEVMRCFGFEGSYALVCDGGRSTIGLSRQRVLERVAASEALINVNGFLNDREILAAAARRVFLDIDPGFGQIWQATGLHDGFVDHEAHVTIAENIGKPGCTIPTCGLAWITTRQPIVAAEWPSVGHSPDRARPITSVASWRGSYGPVTYDGATYGLRVHEFRKFATLPSLTSARFELALDIHQADGKDIELLRGNGWQLVDPRLAAGDPWRYRDYIRGSAAELMIAKGMYVGTRSGWFSDRSVCYLATGRPVLTQDTGLEGVLPLGTGLLAFATLDEAAAAAEAIRADYARHARAARELAVEYFDSSAVLSALSRKLNLCA